MSFPGLRIYSTYIHSTQNLMQPFSDTRDVEQRETSLLTVAKQRDDVPPISIYLFECVRPINVISISFIYSIIIVMLVEKEV